MALPVSGDIAIGGSTIRSINYEFGRSNTATTSFSELYRGGSLVQATNTNVPASGAISLDNFHNARQSGSRTYTSGSGDFTVPNGVNSITYSIVGGGGGGSAGYQVGGQYPGYGGYYIGGGGGSGGRRINQTLAVTPGQLIAYSVGGGGSNQGGGGYANVIGTAGGATTFGGVSATGGASGTGYNDSGNGGNRGNQAGGGGAAGSPGGSAGVQPPNTSGSIYPYGGAGVSVNGTTYGTGGDGGSPNPNTTGTVGTGGVVYISWG